METEPMHPTDALFDKNYIDNECNGKIIWYVSQKLCCRNESDHMGLLLQTWVNFNHSMDK